MVATTVDIEARRSDQHESDWLAACTLPAARWLLSSDENMRAITVRVDDVVGVAGFLLPGNYVDVVAARIDHSDPGALPPQTILQKILKVLAVDQKAATERERAGDRAGGNARDDPGAIRDRLVKAREEGTIQLTLRNPNDGESRSP